MPFKSTINSGLPNTPDPPDPKFFAEFTRVYNAIRNIQIAVDAYCGTLAADPDNYSQTPPNTTILLQNTNRLYVKFSENVSYGQIVNLHNVAGVLNARLAKASVAGFQGQAWCSTVVGVTAGNFAEVMLGGLCTAISGLTPGQTYYLGNTAGTIAPTTGTVTQLLGYALTSNNLYFRPNLLAS
jgi:hypothetical protein